MQGANWCKGHRIDDWRSVEETFHWCCGVSTIFSLFFISLSRVFSFFWSIFFLSLLGNFNLTTRIQPKCNATSWMAINNDYESMPDSIRQWQRWCLCSQCVASKRVCYKIQRWRLARRHTVDGLKQEERRWERKILSIHRSMTQPSLPPMFRLVTKISPSAIELPSNLCNVPLGEENRQEDFECLFFAIPHVLECCKHKNTHTGREK